MMYVKGRMITHLTVFMKERNGELGLGRWESALSHQARDIFGDKIAREEWYPLKLSLIDPVDSACRLFYKNSLRGALYFGQYVAGNEKSRAILPFTVKASADSKIRKICKGLQAQFDSGEVSLVEAKDDAAIVRVSLPEMDHVLEAIVAGWIKRSAEDELSARAAIEVINSSVREGYAEYLVKWSTFE